MMGGLRMRTRRIPVYLAGDAAPIAAALDNARLRCVQEALGHYSAPDQAAILHRLQRRYGAPDRT